MGFASAWIEEKALYAPFIQEAPDHGTSIIVVVPAYNEPLVTATLDSLKRCIEPDCKVEVIIVINAPSDAPHEHLEGNRLARRNIESWKRQNIDCFFRLFFFEPEALPGWGVGMARKTGMDEAMRRFDTIGNHQGLIVCLDADCTVEINYLECLNNEFLKRRDRQACSIYFEHPLSGNEYDVTIYRSILLYELHLRYYYQGLIFSGFPYAFQTTGSAMAVKALSYMKSGGMNRKQAGEDFYFIQKLVPSGGYFYLNSTTVYPSPRKSYRVPFGTGASIQKLSEENGPTFLTYNFEAFIQLKSCFSMLESFYDSELDSMKLFYEKLPPRIRSFIGEIEWIEKLTEIKYNTSGYLSFRKRFYGWFNMFKIVKFLNFVHQHQIARVPVETAAADLLRSSSVKFAGNQAEDLIKIYRSLEKSV